MTALLTDNLPLLAGAPNGIKKLRELVLELAVRGKLVPQDPSDEPASELLMRIAEEKARLVAEGKIKNQKPLAEISEEERLFDLPPSWSWTRLAAIGVTATGGTPSTGNPEFFGGDLPFIGPGQINGAGQISDPEKWLTELARPETTVAKPGDIFMVCIGGSIGKGAIADRELAFNQQINSVAILLASFRYVFNAMSGPKFQDSIRSAATGSATPIINRTNWDQLLISLPPLAEQHRIVAKVDELMALCDRLETQQFDAESAHAQLVQALLDSLIQVSDASDFAANWERLAENFHTLFTSEPSIDALKKTLLQLAVMGKLVPQDPYDEPASKLLEKIVHEIALLHFEGKIRKPKPVEPITTEEEAFETPNGWKWVRLSQIARQLGDGLHGTPTYSPGGEYYFVNGNNLKGGKIVIKPETRTVSESEYFKHKKPLDKQTVLVSINGTIGNVAFYDSEKIVLGKSACYFNLASEVSKYFVRLLIEAPGFMEYAFKSATGTTIMNLGLKAMNDYPIALPPLAEQLRIVAKADQLMALCDQLKNCLSQGRQLNEQLASTLVKQAVAR